MRIFIGVSGVDQCPKFSHKNSIWILLQKKIIEHTKESVQKKKAQQHCIHLKKTNKLPYLSRMFFPNDNDNDSDTNCMNDDETTLTKSIDADPHNPSSRDRSHEQIPMERFGGLDTVSLVSLMRADTDCCHMLHNLLDDGKAALHRNAAVDNFESQALCVSLSQDIMDIEPLDYLSEHAIDFSPNTVFPEDAVEPEPAVSSAENEVGSLQRTIVSFSESEVRQNAFFFIVSRGGMVLDQPGNRRLRRIVNMYAEPYVQAQRINRGAIKNQVYNLCRGQFEFVIQKQVFMRSYAKDVVEKSVRRHLSHVRIHSILEANGGLGPIQACEDTDFVRVGEDCAIDVVGHLLRDAANEFRRSLDKKAKT